MATAPTPFFPTTMVSLPPCGCEAPPYAPCSFSPAAIYSPTPFPGGYYPPAFPCADTYSKQPSADAYTPANGFSPNWPTWPPPSPDPTPSTSPATFSSFPTSTYGSPSLPSVANYHHPFPFTMAALPYVPPTPAMPESTAPAETPATALLHRPDRVPGSPLPTDLSSPTPQLLDTIQTAPNLERCKNLPLASSTRSDPTLLSEFVLQLELARRSLLDISRQLDEYQTQSKRSIASLKRGISKLVDRVPSSNSSTKTAPTPSVTPSSASTTMAESFTSVLPNIAPAYVGPKVLDEMPQYGLHNLSRHSLFRADGTEHNYFTLPADYPLERDVPKPVFDVYDDDELDGGSNESVHVFTDTPEHQIYEEENQESFEALKCCSKTTFSARKPIVGTVGIFSLENDARACNFSVLKASNSVSTRSNQLSIEHCKRESRLLWDPGASTFLVTPLKNDSSTDSISNEHVGRLVNSTGNFSFQDKTDVWCQSEHQFRVIRRVFEEVMVDKPPAKPPDIYGIAASSPQVILLKIHKAENSSVHFNFWICNSKKLSAIQAILVLAVPCSKGNHVAKHAMSLSNGGCSMTNHCFPQLLMQSLCAATTLQVTKQRHHLEFILMSNILQTLSEFRDGQLTYMPQSPMIKSSEFLRHMVTVLSCYLSSLQNGAKLQWDPGIAISSYMLNWLKMRAVKTLHWLKWPLLNDEECQSAMSNTPCVWDPGIESLLFPCNRLNITKLIQIKRWTSMTYSGISLSEYPYTMMFLHDQWNFIHQQGIQEIYNPKLLLSSQDCARSKKWMLSSLHFYLLDTINEFWWIIDDDESF